MTITSRELATLKPANAQPTQAAVRVQPKPAPQPARRSRGDLSLARLLAWFLMALVVVALAGALLGTATANA